MKDRREGWKGRRTNGIEMVFVEVRKEDEIDRGQLINRDRRIRLPLGSDSWSEMDVIAGVQEVGIYSQESECG